MACRIAGIFNKHGVRKYGVIRIDSAEFGVAKWRENPKANTAKHRGHLQEGGEDRGAITASASPRKAKSAGRACIRGRTCSICSKASGMPKRWASRPTSRTRISTLLGYNAPEHALLKEGYSDAEFWAAYEKMTDKLRPWTIDFHVAQNDGTRAWRRRARQDRQALPRPTIPTASSTS